MLDSRRPHFRFRIARVEVFDSTGGLLSGQPRLNAAERFADLSQFEKTKPICGEANRRNHF